MQQVTSRGLQPARGAKQRYKMMTMQNANEETLNTLSTLWQNKTPGQAVSVLKKPDVSVTNTSDKEVQLEKLVKLVSRALT